MGIVISPDSALGKELAKWEQHRTKYVSDEEQPGNPYTYRPYPKMLYRAQPHPISKQTRCMDVEPDVLQYATVQEYERALNMITRFNTACTRIVMSDDEQRRAMNDGWRESPDLAMAAAEQREIELSTLAAERHYKDRSMSEKAQAEAAEADRSTSAHVVDVVGASKKTRGRPRKIQAVTA